MGKLNQTTSTGLDSLSLLRSLAAIIILCCHFSHALPGRMFGIFQDYGRYRVQIFFVISGFVIPLSLLRGKYAISDYGRFLYKRLLRLHPPYIAGLAITLIIMYFSYKARNAVFPENAVSILKSFFYLHSPADNPVFWTMLVEAQYYLLIGLFYPVLIRWPKIAFGIAIPVMLALGYTFITQYIALFSYIVYFLTGTIGFLVYTNTGNRVLNISGLAVALIFSFFFSDTVAFYVTIVSIAVILGFRGTVPEFMKFPGKISYSIFLIHFPIGVKFINLMKPRIDPSYGWLLFLATMILAMSASWLFYKVFEEHAIKLAKKIRYKANPKKPDILPEKNSPALNRD